MPWASALMLIGCGAILALGVLHLVYTFVGTRLRPRDPALVARMQATRLAITPHTDVWRAWLGFNASHSLNAILFAALFGWLAWSEPTLLFGSVVLASLAFAWLAAMLVLAARYWFRVPLAGLVFATACSAAAYAVAGLG